MAGRQGKQQRRWVSAAQCQCGNWHLPQGLESNTPITVSPRFLQGWPLTVALPPGGQASPGLHWDISRDTISLKALSRHGDPCSLGHSLNVSPGEIGCCSFYDRGLAPGKVLF